jgi:hypothetical protein
MQAVAEIRWCLVCKCTVFTAKEADEDIRTTEIAAERGVAFCVVCFVIKIPYDMIQDFRIRVVLVLYYFLKEPE